MMHVEQTLSSCWPGETNVVEDEPPLYLFYSPSAVLQIYL
jgi:hypothetical protein